MKDIVDWLRESGLKVVNEEKTEICVFPRNIPNQIIVRIEFSPLGTIDVSNGH